VTIVVTGARIYYMRYVTKTMVLRQNNGKNIKMTDKLDEGIIGILRLNARLSVSAIAARLKISRSTVQDRMRRLETKGTIRGYSVDLGTEAEASQIRAFVTVSIEPQRTAVVTAELKTLLSVNSIHTVSGKFDLMVEMSTTNTAEMDKALDRVTEIPGVLKTETSIVLSTKLQR